MKGAKVTCMQFLPWSYGHLNQDGDRDGEFKPIRLDEPGERIMSTSFPFFPPSRLPSPFSVDVEWR